MSKAFGQQDVDVQQIENVGMLVSVALVKEDVFALGGAAITTFTVRSVIRRLLFYQEVMPIGPCDQGGAPAPVQDHEVIVG